MIDLEQISKSQYGPALLEILEGVKTRIADVRNLGTIDQAARLAAIRMLDEELVTKIKLHIGKRNSIPDDSFDE